MSNENPVYLPSEDATAARFQIAQAMYHAVTEKTEKISKAYSKDFLITRERFWQLHEKCHQACSQWVVKQQTTNVTIFHVDDTKEVFSSFKRSELSDASNTCATESILYEFNLLIQLPNTNRLQPYKVSVRAVSRIAAFDRMEKEGGPSRMFRVFGPQTLLVEIEYVDYAVARNLLSMVNSWVEQIEIPSKIQWIKHVQKRSHWFPNLSRLIAVSALTFSLYRITPTVILSDAVLSQGVRWLILALGLLLCGAFLGKTIGGFLESAVDEIFPISAIKFNQGDDSLYAKYCRRNRFIVGKALVGSVIVICQAVFANFTTDWLKFLMNWT